MLRSLAVRSMLCLLALAMFPAARARADDSVAVIARAAVDQRVAEELLRLGIRMSRRPMDGALDGRALVSATRDWSEAWVLVVESETSSLRVLRRADGLMLVRVFDAGFFEASPYAAALAASELLDISAQTPVVVAAKPPDTAHATPAPAPAVTAGPGPWRLLLSAGGELAASPRTGLSLWRPQLALGLETGAARGAFGLAQVVAAPFGRLTRSVPEGSPGDNVEYRRSDVGVRLGAGARLLAGSVLGYLGGGLGVLSASARSAGSQRASDRRVGSWWAAGGQFRYEPWRVVALVFGMELVWIPRPVTYLVQGRTTLREDSLRFGTSFALSFRLR